MSYHLLLAITAKLGDSELEIRLGLERNNDLYNPAIGCLPYDKKQCSSCCVKILLKS